ncbi:MAG: hypothetical protein MUF06_22815 [Pirellulaceae bacterium]|nr:hypothetical protein [Pirellulaceae bacterium]
MSPRLNEPLTLARMREVLYSAVIADACDACGFPRQSPRVPLRPLTTSGVLIGRCKTTLWAEMSHRDPRPYELELSAQPAVRCGRDSGANSSRRRLAARDASVPSSTERYAIP